MSEKPSAGALGRNRLIARLREMANAPFHDWEDRRTWQQASDTIARLAAAEAETKRLREERDEARAEAVKWQRIRNPTHGPCCTCQRCGEHYDDCRCDLDILDDDLRQAETEVKRLREALEHVMDVYEVRCHHVAAIYRSECPNCKARVALDGGEE